MWEFEFNTSLIVHLAQNAAILLAFSVMYEHFWLKKASNDNKWYSILTGLVIGFIGVILMLTPWTLAPGINFDTRSVLLSVSGLFFGGFPTLIAAIVTAAFRFIHGGDGLAMGIAIIVSSSTIGVTWKKLRPNWIAKNHSKELLLMGLVVNLILLGCAFLLPRNIVYSTIVVISIPILMICLPATVLIGNLMVHQRNNFLNRNAKKKLSESERRYFEILNGSNVFSVLLNKDGRITFCNKYLLSMTGYTKEELLGKNWLELLPPKSQRSAIREVLDGPKKCEKQFSAFENEILCKDGNILYIAWSNSVLRNTEGIVVGTASIGFDVTKQKMIEKELQTHRDKLEEQVQLRTTELVVRNKELERLNEIFINREFRIKELKRKLSLLKKNDEDKSDK